MKTIFLFNLLISGFVLGQSESELHEIKTIFLENFPENVQFVNYENSSDQLEDTLFYRFHRPEIEISQDSIQFSYIKEDKDWNENFSRFEKLEWKLAFKDLEQFYGFEFTFGNWDRFRPNLYYWNFESDIASVTATEMTLEEFENNEIPKSNPKKAENSAWLPTQIQSHRKLEKKINKLIRK